VVGQASSLSISNDGQPRVPRGASPPNHFVLFAITFENHGCETIDNANAQVIKAPGGLFIDPDGH
jgi:hypothetical protein